MKKLLVVAGLLFAQGAMAEISSPDFTQISSARGLARFYYLPWDTSSDSEGNAKLYDMVSAGGG